MELKQSDLGKIPKDWEVSTLQELCRETISYGIVQCGPHVRDGVPYIRVTDMTDDILDVDQMLRTAPEIAAKFNRSRVETDDLVYALRGRLGDVRRIPPDLNGANLTQGTARIAPKPPISSTFLIWAMRDPRILRQAELESKGTTFKEITLADLRKLKVLLPTEKEQKAIANALSDVDTYIESLENLVAKKRLIKSSLLQEAFTPKADWKLYKLGDSAILKARIGWQGLTTAEYLTSGDYGLVTGTDFKNGKIDWDNCHFVTKDRYDQDRNIQLKENDILVTKDGTIGKIALIDSIPQPTTLNSGVFVVRPINKAFDPKCFYYLLISTLFDEFLAQLAAGSTISHLYQKDFINFKFKLPNLETQKEIGSNLFNVDYDIELYEKKLQKARLLKQGMMQELLTGRIRLV